MIAKCGTRVFSIAVQIADKLHLAPDMRATYGEELSAHNVQLAPKIDQAKQPMV